MNHSPETSYEQSAIHYIKHLMSRKIGFIM